MFWRAIFYGHAAARHADATLTNDYLATLEQVVRHGPPGLRERARAAYHAITRAFFVAADTRRTQLEGWRR